MRLKKGKRLVLFWLKSSRGTDEKAVFMVPKSWKEDELKGQLENWCSYYGAWTHGDNFLQYGYKGINKLPPRKELLKAWDKLCDRKNRITERWKIMQQMFNVRELGEDTKFERRVT